MQKLALTNMIADYKDSLTKVEARLANPRATKPAQWRKVADDLKAAIANAESILASL